MDDDLITRLAREAGLPQAQHFTGLPPRPSMAAMWGVELRRFAALVAGECIKIVEGDHDRVYEACDLVPTIVDAIRAKFKETP